MKDVLLQARIMLKVFARLIQTSESPRMKTLILASVALTLALPASAAVVESENNGSIGAADVVSLSGAGTETVQGTISTNPADGLGDYDYFLLGNFSVPGFIQVSTSSSFDTYIGLYNAAGTLVAQDDDGLEIFGDSLMSFNVTTPGAYTLVIRGFGSGFASDPFSLTPGNPVGAQGAYTATIQYRGADGTVPEPGSFALAGLALTGLAAMRRRSRPSR